jgi:hypothetical protein
MGLYKPFQKQPWMLKRWVTREGMDIPPLIWLTISIPTMRLLKNARMSKTHIYHVLTIARMGELRPL